MRSGPRRCTQPPASDTGDELNELRRHELNELRLAFGFFLVFGGFGRR